MIETGSIESVGSLPLDARFDHIAGHELQSLFEVSSEFGIGPVQIADERLQSVQFPEQVLRCRTAVSEQYFIDYSYSLFGIECFDDI